MCIDPARLKRKISWLCSQESSTMHASKLIESVGEVASNEDEVSEKGEDSDLDGRMPFVSVRQKKKSASPIECDSLVISQRVYVEIEFRGKPFIAWLHEGVGEAVKGVFLEAAHKGGRIGAEQVHLVRGK